MTAQMMAVDNNVVVVMLVSVAICLLAWLLIYITRQVVIGTNTSVLLTADILALNSANYTTITTANMPASVNGNSFTYTFWIKLMTFDQTSTHKILWFRSSGTNDALGSPLVMLDSSSNRMYVLLATNLTPLGITFSDVTGRRIDELRSNLRFAVAVIDYVPMTRWAHIGIIVNDCYVQLALDGVLYSSGTVDNYASASSADSVRPMIKPASGTIYIGGQPSVQGSMTRLQFSNYPMNIADIKKMYDALPSGSSMFSLVGLPQYGLRNPIYRISS
jgi:hypothetical protein